MINNSSTDMPILLFNLTQSTESPEPKA